MTKIFLYPLFLIYSRLPAAMSRSSESTAGTYIEKPLSATSVSIFFRESKENSTGQEDAFRYTWHMSELMSPSISLHMVFLTMSLWITPLGKRGRFIIYEL